MSFSNKREYHRDQETMAASACLAPWKRASCKQALVPASLLTSVLDGSLLSVDVRPLVVHVLHGLASAGIERAVVVLGVGAEQLVHSIQAEVFATMRVDSVANTLRQLQPWQQGHEGRIELVQRARLWRYLSGDPTYDADYYLTRLEDRAGLLGEDEN